MTLTLRAARMAADLKIDDLSTETMEKAKLLLLDHLGCMIGGSAVPEAVRLRTYLESIDGGGESSVYGTRRMSAPNAAHANAHAASILSLDDSYIRFGHPGAAILPAALAVGEALDASKSDLLVAAVAGYEMCMRLGMAVRSSPERDRQVKGYASWQVFGAATAAAKLHKLSAEQLASAFGMTAWHAPPSFLRKFHGRPMNWLKNNYGWACKGGITAVDLTVAGFEGNRAIFDGDDGYWAMMGADRFDPEMLVLPYDERCFVQEIGFKPYSGCRWSNTAIDCIRALMAKNGVTRDKLERLEIETVSDFVSELNGAYPKATIEAIFHTPYLVALELNGRSSALGLKDRDLTDNAVRETVSRISMTALAGADEAFIEKGALPVRMTARLKNGKTADARAAFPTGHPDGPAFGRDEVRHKFTGLSEPVIGPDRAKQMAARVLDLENQSVQDVMRL